MKRKFIHEKRIKLHIDENKYYPIDIDVKDTLDLHIELDKHISASLFITYYGVDITCNLHVHAKEDSHCNLVFWNECSHEFHCQQQVDIMRDAELTIGYGDLSHAIIESNLQVDLREEGSSIHLISACVSGEKKHYTMNCLHHIAHTSSQMENYSVIKEFGDYRMEANGQILKGAYQSTSLQATRVLTMSENQKSEVIPLLLIDENDVKAGHASTVGQPDENQLYYLQTRGLTRDQALSLLIAGYMMPITKIIDQQDLSDKLQADIEKKVGYHV